MPVTIPDGDYLSLEHQVCFALAVASRDVIALYRPLLEPLGLTHPQYLAMVSLWHDNHTTTVTALSTALGLEPPALSPVLKRLESAGLVNRRRDPHNQRTVQISLTPKGRALREQALEIPGHIIDRLDMSIDELETLRTMLMKVIHKANTSPARPTHDWPANLVPGRTDASPVPRPGTRRSPGPPHSPVGS